GPHTRAISMIEGEQKQVFAEARDAGTRDSVENHAARALGRVFDRAGRRRADRPARSSATGPAARSDSSGGAPTDAERSDDADWSMTPAALDDGLSGEVGPSAVVGRADDVEASDET